MFGVPLVDSIQYARYSISYQDENAVVYRQAGAIPTLVAKTGYYLKQNGIYIHAYTYIYEHYPIYLSWLI